MIDHKKALAYFQNLYLVALADDFLMKEESSFLIQVAQAFGISAKETTDIIGNIKHLDLIIPESPEERLNQLEDITTMMMIDKKIHEKEFNLCLRFAEKIGYNRNTLDQLILKIAKGE